MNLLPMFLIQRHDHDTVFFTFGRHGIQLTLAPITGLDAPVLAWPEVTVQFHLPNGASPLTPVSAPPGEERLTRRHLVNGIRRSIRHLYRQSHVLPQACALDPDTLPALSQLLAVETRAHHSARRIQVILEALPQPTFRPS